jgi:hypothetical protein
MAKDERMVFGELLMACGAEFMRRRNAANDSVLNIIKKEIDPPAAQPAVFF